MLYQFKKRKPSGLDEFSSYIETEELDAYQHDFGHMIIKRPSGVFTPPTVEILQRFLKMAAELQLKIILRGQGNSAFGQTLIDDGYIVDLKNLNEPVTFDNDNKAVTFPAFKTWQEMIEHTKEKNKTFPVTIDNLALTVGGTLSFGALGGTSYRVGSGADNVLALDVVTLDGERHYCTKTENSDLFNAMLCGMGQFGFIINVKLPLVDAKLNVRNHLLTYRDPNFFLQQQKVVYEAGVFDHLKGFSRKMDGEWGYVIEAASYFDLEESEEVRALLNQLKPEWQDSQTLSYWDFINLVTGFVNFIKEGGKLDVPHPWYNVLIPEDSI